MMLYNTITGETRNFPPMQADHLMRNSFGEWSGTKPLPPGWDREIPKYRASKAVKPAERARYKTEKPFASIGDNDVWQYGDRLIDAGETIETTAWPHASFVALNESARRTLAFFVSQQKSRLPLSPWRNGRLRLDDGLGGFVDFAPPPLPKIPPIQMPGAR